MVFRARRASEGVQNYSWVRRCVRRGRQILRLLPLPGGRIQEKGNHSRAWNTRRGERLTHPARAPVPQLGGCVTPTRPTPASARTLLKGDTLASAAMNPDVPSGLTKLKRATCGRGDRGRSECAAYGRERTGAQNTCCRKHNEHNRCMKPSCERDN
jgi:hypothetical protein